MISKALFLLVLTLFITINCVHSRHSYYSEWTPLDEYVNTSDPAFNWSVVKTEEINGVSVTLINMTSQTWQNERTVEQPIWFHYILIAVPKTILVKDKGFLLIDGGANPRPPKLNNEIITMFSATSGSIVAGVFDVPNQPFTFKNDTETGRVEDGIIAYTWQKFIETRNPYWLLRFPMVKASVRALDVVQTFAKSQLGLNIEEFTVAGASKRGWTAWLTAAVDTQRVKTVVPMVIDLLDLPRALKHIHDSLCAWPEAMHDYEKQGVTKFIGEPVFQDLADQVDPFVFRDRLVNTEKMIINAGNDQFFWPDGSTFSFPYLPGNKKRLRYIPNTDHSMSGSDVLFSLGSYYYARLHDIKLPQYTFDQKFTKNGAEISITILTNDEKKPTQVNLWTSTNPNGRDFRISTVGRNWVSQTLSSTTNTFVATVSNPPTGYTAFMIELVFDKYFDKIQLPALKFTTSAYITPNTLPCH